MRYGRRAVLAGAAVFAGGAAPVARFAALEEAAGGRLGVAGLNTGSGALVLYRADERFPFCSTYKALLAAAVLRRNGTEPGLLSRTVPITPADMSNYTPITRAHVGGTMTVEALCQAAVQYSDNTAANLLMRLLGGPAGVTAFARSIGDGAFRLDRWEPGLNAAVPGDARDTTTPAAMLADLRLILAGNLLGQAERAKLLGWMRDSRTGLTRIRAAAPAGWIVGDKSGGGEYGTTNDVAVLSPPGRPPLVLVVYFTQRAKDAPDAGCGGGGCGADRFGRVNEAVRIIP